MECWGLWFLNTLKIYMNLKFQKAGKIESSNLDDKIYKFDVSQDSLEKFN